MSEKELIIWFEEKLNNCYQLNIGGNILWIYDKNYIRKKKIAQIEGKEIKLPPNHENRNNILFYQREFSGCITFQCNYQKVWKILENKFDSKYRIENFIKKRLKSRNLEKTSPKMCLNIPPKIFKHFKF